MLTVRGQNVLPDEENTADGRYRKIIEAENSPY